ncbi:hypothetical protein RCF14_28010 [Klebsiella pneumoniae]|nr:hypothetical protein [Klebsiella pneumoniae]
MQFDLEFEQVRLVSKAEVNVIATKTQSNKNVGGTVKQKGPSSKAAQAKEGANKQVISSQADSLIKISRIWADFFPANTSNQPI